MSSYSTSYSTPVTPPADLVTQGILDNISNVALNYANQIYNWGQGVFNNVQAVTNQNIAQLTQAASTAMSGATQSMGAFTNSFMPDYQTLRTNAANYANVGRQARNAGMAESDQMQAGEAARRSAEQNLESYGIDPSSGRYADLENANKTASAAAAAGAGTQSIRADESTALGLQNEALQYGIQLPGIAANFLNQANQATGLSQNAVTSAANTGANLMSLPNSYLSTAKVPYPPTGNASSSQRTSNSPPKTGGGSGGSGGGSNNLGTGGAPYNPNWDSQMYTGGSANTGFTSGAYDNSGGMGESSPVNGTQFDQYTANNSLDYGGQSDPQAANYGGYNTGDSSINPSYDTSASYNDPTASSYGTDTSSYNDTSMGAAPSDWASYSDASGGFNAGGAIPEYAAGGQVPVQASPSMGQQTDDVHARLNAGEFVVPKDVAAWKGHEFFQKLIAQSRKARATAPAQGKPAAPPTGPVRFTTR